MTTKLAIIGTENYENKSKIKDFIFKFKNQSKNIIISSGGRQYGADKYIRKYSIEFGLQYQEYNPAYTVKNLYSVMYNSYYGKKFMLYHDTHRNKLMIDDNECIVIFNNEDEKWSREFEDILKYCTKKEKKVIIIN
jgi:hypothetical protein